MKIKRLLLAVDQGLVVVGERAKVETFLGRRTCIFPLSILHMAHFLPGRLELRGDAPPRGAPAEELRELPGEHAPELVASEEEFHIGRNDQNEPNPFSS